MPVEAIRIPLAVVAGPRRIAFKTHRLILADRVALLIALFVAAAVSYCWLLGIIGLWGLPQFRFSDAMFTWMIEAELILVLPLWLFLRTIDVIVKMKTGRHM